MKQKVQILLGQLRHNRHIYGYNAAFLVFNVELVGISVSFFIILMKTTDKCDIVMFLNSHLLL